MIKGSFYIAMVAFFILVISSCSTKKSVDLIVHNGVVYTVDSIFTVNHAFAVKGGKFIAIGTNQDILSAYDAKTVIDAEGKAVFPGFYDAHAHLFGLASVLDEASLFGAASFEEVLERLKAFRTANPDREWLIGRGWDQNLWPDKQFPTKEQLDKVFPDVPVYLVRIDGHAAIVNSKALQMAEINEARDVEGGYFHVENGELSGVLIDNAMAVVSRLIPRPSEEDWERMLLKAQDSCLAVGLTTVVDAGLSREQIGLLKQLYTDGTLKIRDYAMVALSSENLDYFLEEGIYESEKLNVRSFKIMGDGALGSRGACLLHDYSDAETKGFLLSSPQTFNQVFERLAASDFQANTHAIGDSANRVVLDLYGKHLKGENNRRWRIEHAQILNSADIIKFAKFSIIPSVQPTHATSDMYWAEERLGGERIKGAYAYRDLLKEAGMLALGSDFPVEHFNPLYGFHAAVARVDESGYPKGGFNPENAISRIDALRAMTIWAAYASFEEDSHGSIEIGKAADFVILSDDIMKIDNKELRGVKVLRTVIAGESVYEHNISD